MLTCGVVSNAPLYQVGQEINVGEWAMAERKKAWQTNLQKRLHTVKVSEKFRGAITQPTTHSNTSIWLVALLLFELLLSCVFSGKSPISRSDVESRSKSRKWRCFNIILQNRKWIKYLVFSRHRWISGVTLVLFANGSIYLSSADTRVGQTGQAFDSCMWTLRGNKVWAWWSVLVGESALKSLNIYCWFRS